MPKDIMIRVLNLDKKYNIGKTQCGYSTFSETAANLIKTPINQILYGNFNSSDEFWALKNISFDVYKGEIVGIIGRNGAGKSTLLKILSRITSPTNGRVELYGQVKSLLEVGTGFHPELTGRENIYLSGSILGMEQKEVEDKFDTIVKFSEIEKFLDTPVKRYSSGMYVRLAFSIAAHMDTEILLIDEVLAVGDILFQKKCIGKMGDASKEGRTVLFVSHNMSAISSLCTRGILLSDGKIIKDGEARDITSEYQSIMYSHINESSDLTNVERYGNGKCRFTSIRITPYDNDQNPQKILQVGQNLEIALTIFAHQNTFDANVAIIIYEQSGYRIIDANTLMKNSPLSLLKGQTATVTFTLKNVLCKPGEYLLGLWIGRTNIEDIDGMGYAKQFSIETNPYTSKSSYKFPGVYLCEYDHSIELT